MRGRARLALVALGSSLVLGAGPRAPPAAPAEDLRGVEALYAAYERALERGELGAAAELLDFPVFVLTDSESEGPSAGESWTKERWLHRMQEPGVNLPRATQARMSRKVTFLSSGLALVSETTEATSPLGKQVWRSGSVLVRRDGRWRFKSLVEAGWATVGADGGTQR